MNRAMIAAAWQRCVPASAMVGTAVSRKASGAEIDRRPQDRRDGGPLIAKWAKRGRWGPWGSPGVAGNVSLHGASPWHPIHRTYLTTPSFAIGQPSGIQTWTGNRIFRNGVGKDGAAQPFVIGDAMPPVAEPKRMTWAAVAVRMAQPPALDGEIGLDEWPRELLQLDREPSRWPAGGAPVFARLAYDDRCLYVAVNVVVFQAGKLRGGTAWGADDGAEISIGGRTLEGQPVSFVARGFAGGACQSVTDAGAPVSAAERLGKEVRFAAKTYGKASGGWRGEWAIPFEALGVKPAPGLKVAFNLAVYRSEDDVWRCWEGTVAETWKLDEAGTLQFK